LILSVGQWILSITTERNINMAVKSYKLMKLEELGVFIQNKKTGAWYCGFKEDVDLTEYLYAAGMFEH